MNLNQLLKQRRATKNFDENHTMSDEELKELLDTAILSPTSYNLQHWRIVNVKDPVLRQKNT